MRNKRTTKVISNDCILKCLLKRFTAYNSQVILGHKQWRHYGALQAADGTNRLKIPASLKNQLPLTPNML